MPTHLEIGQAGEKMAEAWLAERGFTVIHRNWRCGGQDEIDLIAIKNERLHFVEVKYRTSLYAGPPEAAVTKQKIKILMRGIEQYLHKHKGYDDFRLNVLAITHLPGSEPEYFFIEDVT